MKSNAIRAGVAFTVCVSLVLGGCFGGRDARDPTTSSTNRSTPVTKGGGFYGGDRPPAKVPKGLEQIPDAVPQRLPLSKTGNNPYVALGKKYRPLKSAKGYRATGTASWYGKKFHGRRTSSGEPYDMFAMTAAHTVLPLPSFVRVTSLENGRSVVVKVNDRGPFLHGRLIDLSYAAAHKLGITARGTGKVRVEFVDAGPILADAVSKDEAPTVFTGTAGAGSSVVATTTALQKSGEDREYRLQIGAFSDLINALTLRKQLRQQGLLLIPPTDKALSAADDAPYRVVVGPFTDIQRAESVRQILTKTNRTTGQTNRWITGVADCKHFRTRLNPRCIVLKISIT